MQNLNYLYVVFVTSPFKESKHCPGCGLVCFISDPNPGFSKVGSESVFLRLDPDPFFCRSDQDPFFSKVGSGPGIFLKVGSGQYYFSQRSDSDPFFLESRNRIRFFREGRIRNQEKPTRIRVPAV